MEVLEPPAPRIEEVIDCEAEGKPEEQKQDRMGMHACMHMLLYMLASSKNIEHIADHVRYHVS